LGAARIPVLVGATGVGKTAVAMALSRHWPLEVVSADSRQVYRRLDIGTAKPPPRWLAKVPHHGLDQVDPGSRYSAGRFIQDAPRWIREIQARGHLPVVVGGTGLYIRALVDGLFAEPPLEAGRRRTLGEWLEELEVGELLRWSGRLDVGFKGGGRQRAMRSIEVALLPGRPLSYWQQTTRQSGAIDPWYVYLTAPRAVLHHRIEVRAEEMVRRGLIEEVAAVLSEGHPARSPGLDAIGIREAVEYLHGKRTRESVAAAAATSTRQYAKRQETWFRHQLTGPVLTMDATRPPEELADEIAKAWAAKKD